jgi:hypothetical protein
MAELPNGERTTNSPRLIPIECASAPTALSLGDGFPDAVREAWLE